MYAAMIVLHGGRVPCQWFKFTLLSQKQHFPGLAQSWRRPGRKFNGSILSLDYPISTLNFAVDALDRSLCPGGPSASAPVFRESKPLLFKSTNHRRITKSQQTRAPRRTERRAAYLGPWFRTSASVLKTFGRLWANTSIAAQTWCSARLDAKAPVRLEAFIEMCYVIFSCREAS